jgi:hypothetical protein
MTKYRYAVIQAPPRDAQYTQEQVWWVWFSTYTYKLTSTQHDNRVECKNAQEALMHSLDLTQKTRGEIYLRHHLSAGGWQYSSLGNPKMIQPNAARVVDHILSVSGLSNTAAIDNQETEKLGHETSGVNQQPIEQFNGYEAAKLIEIMFNKFTETEPINIRTAGEWLRFARTVKTYCNGIITKALEELGISGVDVNDV